MIELKTGFGRADITPDKLDISLNSIVRSTEIRQRITVSSVVISDGDNISIIICNDLRNSTAYIVDIIKRKINEMTGLPQGNVFVISTHNHSCPDVNFVDKRPDITDWFYRIYMPAMIKAVADSIADLKPTTVKSGVSEGDKSASYVRRYFRSDGEFWTVNMLSKSDAPITYHESEADRQLRAVRFCRDGGKDIVLVNYQVHAAHGASKNKGVVCADFVHKLREKTETENDVYVVYLQGGCGNINTFTKVKDEPFQETYDDVGETLATAVTAAINNATPQETGNLKIINSHYTAAVNHAKSHLAPKAEELMDEIYRNGIKDKDELMKLASEKGFASRYEAAAIIRRSKLEKTDDIPLSTLAFGDVAITFTPAEMFDINYMQIRDASPFKTTLTCGYTNGNVGYIPSAYGFSNGGYEVLQSSYIPGTAENCTIELIKQLRECKK